MTMNLDDKLVKKVGDKDDVPLTEEQAAEWVKCANDKYYFFENYVYVQSPKGKALFVPRGYQRRIIDACTNNRMVVALSGRQSGKCQLGESKIILEISINSVTMEVEATMLDLHQLASCRTEVEAEHYLEKLRKHHETETIHQGRPA